MIQEFKSKGGLEAQTLLGMITVEQGDSIAGMEMIRNEAEREYSIAEILLYGPNEKTGQPTDTLKLRLIASRVPLRKEFDEETGLYYYGARYYEPRLSLWMSVDPLQEKYPNISTYCYAANNPIKFIDSDGRKLLFASGTTEAFKQKFRAAIMYLHEHNADGIIAQIDKSSTIIYITERVGEASAFSKTKKTIYWDPNMGVLTSSDKKMSPVAVLNHEADHTLQYLKNPDKFAQDSKTLDPDYDDKEEMRVITGSEQKTALALGEISAGEVTRTDHIGIPYITKSPTTTEAKDGKIPKNPFVMDEIVISVPKSKNVNPNNDNNETDNK